MVCSFFNELDPILKRDASVTPLRIVSSLNLKRKAPEATSSDGSELAVGVFSCTFLWRGCLV